jgi:hypothetical protein
MNFPASEVQKSEPTDRNRSASWHWSGVERRWLVSALCAILAFGCYLERRTALRTAPMTDLGVFVNAAWAVRAGGNLYDITDWHGWHYQYPPLLAIAFVPLADPPRPPLPLLTPGESRTPANTPWGYPVEGSQFFGLHRENARFFLITGVWYALSVLGICFSAHALACVLEGHALREPPPMNEKARLRWWKLRLLPLLVCAGSLGTDLSRGQVDIAMLATIATALYLAARGYQLISGLCLAIPAAVKLFPPFLLLYPFWRRRWRMAAAVVLGVTLWLGVVPAAVFGPRHALQLYQTWFEVLAKPALGAGRDRSRATELTDTAPGDNQSLLAAIHNWRYLDLPQGNRPAQYAPAVRVAVYVVGVIALATIGFVSGWRRGDPPRDLLMVAGLLIGLALVVSPIVHNYYYLLLLPLVIALLDRHWTRQPEHRDLRLLPWPLVMFLAIDLVARLPRIGLSLRDIGAPLSSVVLLMAAGICALTQDRLANT